MGFLNKLKQMASDGTKAAQDKLAQFNNAAFAEATMAACALITAADRQISPAERERVAQFIASSEKLRTFDVNVLREKYNTYCDKLVRDYAFGKIELFQVFSKIKKPDEARMIIYLAAEIGNADGDFSEVEKNAVREIIAALNLTSAEFGL